MDYQILMRVLNSSADGPENIEALRYVQAVLIAIDIDRPAFDICFIGISILESKSKAGRSRNADKGNKGNSL